MTSEDELERSLMDDDVVATEQATEDESMPKLLSGLGKTLATISTAMLNMEKSMKRLQPAESSDSEDRPRKKRRHASQTETERGGEGSDAEGLLQSNEPEANLANEGNASEAHVRLEHDALLTEISHDLEQEEEEGGNICGLLILLINDGRQSFQKQNKKKKWTNTLVPKIVKNLLFLALTPKYGTSLTTRPSIMIYVLLIPKSYCLRWVLYLVSQPIDYCKCALRHCQKLIN